MALVCIWCRAVVKDEDEVPDDETINQMLARTEVEYEKFQVDFASIFSAFFLSTRILIKLVNFIAATVRLLTLIHVFEQIVNFRRR